MKSQIMPVVSRELAANGLAAEGKILLAGVSGGADSVALLHALCGLREVHGFFLRAVHVEHGLRGEASLQDAAFVEELCESLHVPLTVHHAAAGEVKKALGVGTEEAARIARYACFEKTMAETGAHGLLLAHHLDDQAETVLMHLMRGSGPKGLQGMLPCVPFSGGLLIRPFLTLPRRTLRKALQEAGFAWREDETNASPDCFRNALRLQVLPELERLSPGCVNAMGRLSVLMASEADYWRKEAECWLKGRSRISALGAFLDRKELLSAHPAYQRQIIRAFYEKTVGEKDESLSYDKTEELLALLDGSGGAVNLPGGVKAVTSRDRLHLILPGTPEAPQPVPLSLTGETCFDGFRLLLQPWQKGMALGDGRRVQALDGERLLGAVVRTRKPGDRISPLGMAGSQPLKEYLIDRHVDRPFRDRIPLIALGGEIVWVCGVGPANTAAVTASTAHAVLFSLEGEFPWELPNDV